MSNENVEKVILNAGDFVDTYRRCNLLYMRPSKTITFQEYTTSTPVVAETYNGIAEYEDNSEIVELVIGDDGSGSLLAFESEDEWLDYMEENFGKKV